MQTHKLLPLVMAEIEERQGQSMTVIDVKDKSSVTDFMIIVTATSTRHSQSIAQYIIIKVKEQGLKPLGLEGEQGSDWVLLDLGDIVLHIMTSEARALYQLEKLWSIELQQPVTE